jgi:hypothetical protein
MNGSANCHQYRVTIEHLHTPHAGDTLDPPLVFETTSEDALMLLFIVNRLRRQMEGGMDSVPTGLAPRRRPASTRPL